MSEKWYYAKDNTPIGPFTSEEMKQLYNDQTIQDATFIWKEGTSDWQFYRDTELSMESVVPDVPLEEETVILREKEPREVQPSEKKPGDGNKEQWYYLKGVTPQGPFTPQQMQALYDTGEIHNKTMVLIEGEETWSSFKESALYIPAAKVELMPDKTEVIVSEEMDNDGATEVYSDDKTSIEPYEYNAFDDFTETPEEIEEWYIDEDGPYTLRALRAIYKRGNISSSSIIAKADGTPISMELLRDEIRQPEIKKDQWFLAKNGQPDGPYDPQDLANKVVSGEISKDALVWKEGMKDWIKIIDSPLLSTQQKEIFRSKQETKPKKSKLPLILGVLAGLCAIGAIVFFIFGRGPKEELSSSTFTGNWKLSKYAPADGDFWDLSLSEVQKLRMTVDYDGDLTIRTNGRDIYVGTWTVDGSKADIEGNLNDEFAELELTVNEDGEVVIKEKPDVTLIFTEDEEAPLVEQNDPEVTEEPVQEPAANPDAGTYKLNYDMNLRSEPNRGSSDAGDMAAGSTVSIVEIENNSDGKWGKTSDGRWICISDANYTYLTKQ